MKTFTNKKTEIVNTQEHENGKKETITLGYANLAIIGLNTPPHGGWTVSEMRKRIKVASKLDSQELDTSIELEDAEFELILACSEIRWQFMHKDVVAFADYLQEINKE